MIKLKNNLSTHLTVLLLLIGLSEQLNAIEIQFSSTEQQTALLELFTSQGCSSCPPAERYLSQLITHKELWQRFVPVAWHVDYWNYLGWRDPLAKPEFSIRQRRYHTVGAVKSVYTPGWLSAGKEWRGWFTNNQRLPIASDNKVGKLRVHYSNNIITANFTPVISIEQPLTLNIAYLGSGIEQRITAGENNRLTLRQDFVVLDHQRYPNSPMGQQAYWRIPYRTLARDDLPAHRKALAVWVSIADQQQPIQATGTWLE